MEHPYDMHPAWDRPAPDCDDQLPLISQAGRGLQGDGYEVIIDYDNPEANETYLKGRRYDAASGTWSDEWRSLNINGGRIRVPLNKDGRPTVRTNPGAIPQTFKLTMWLDRPNRPEWTLTTPAIPYVWDVDGDGKPDVDDVVGSGVTDLFLRSTYDTEWEHPLSTITVADYAAHGDDQAYMKPKHDKLIYPTLWKREQFNAPSPGDVWTVNLTYGVGGDIDVPNVKDWSKFMGVTENNIRDKVEHSPEPTDSIPDESFKKYVDRKDDALDKKIDDEIEKLDTHFHKDLGFGEHLLGDDNDKSNLTVKKYIDDNINAVNVTIKPGTSKEAEDKNLLGITKVSKDESNYEPGVEFQLNPANPTVSGNGLSVDVLGSGDDKVVQHKLLLLAGGGIQFKNVGKYLRISNTQVEANWKTLEAGKDYDFKWHFGWYGGGAEGWNTNQVPSTSDAAWTNGRKNSPLVQVISSVGENGLTITSAQIRIADSGTKGIRFCNRLDMANHDNFLFKHSHAWDETASKDSEKYYRSAILSLEFKGDYISLNSMDVNNQIIPMPGVWNMMYVDTDDLNSYQGEFHRAAISWAANVQIDKNVGNNFGGGSESPYKFVLWATNISDGWNEQLSRLKPNDNSKLVIRPWANIEIQFTLM